MSASSPVRQAAVAAVEAALVDAGVEVDRPSTTRFVVTLPGEAKLKTAVRLDVGEHSLVASAFVVRHADENHEAVYRWLLEQNVRPSPVAFALDRHGDVYLVGRVPVEAVTAEVVDELLGAMLTRADGSFNQLLELGFASAIRREYAWRVKRGESTANLAAFGHLVAEQAEE